MKRLHETPLIGERSQLIETKLGPFSEVGPYNTLEYVELGDYSYTGPYCIVQHARIGKFSNIAAMVRIGPTAHPVERPTLHHITYRRRLYGVGEKDDEAFFSWRRAQVATIGHDTWIGHGAIIMPGVTVGNGAVVGSGAIVTRDVAPYTVVVGVPARPLRMRFSEEIVEALERIRWWDWPHDRIRERIDDLAGNVETFVERYDV
ncbi:MAG: Chloramphenicol acetyltransferase [Candidatus Carbobacillus altaicus]|uniref:Chloramphenicol acetyltransferase n=1 Tax=Candidatus Carbonibacillus altaicus TaxID=2163959 RepID=A0A2R6Y293_9BACL|nr:MAG: Chloramphenicol acetyltransferase [Candidatus Carbobacillus altaicus]